MTCWKLAAALPFFPFLLVPRESRRPASLGSIFNTFRNALEPSGEVPCLDVPVRLGALCLYVLAGLTP